MSVTRDHGNVVFECDRCGEFLETEQDDFEEAIAVKREEGWRGVKDKWGWSDVCPDCFLKERRA